jgi:hypothetical protein
VIFFSPKLLFFGALAGAAHGTTRAVPATGRFAVLFVVYQLSDNQRNRHDKH